MRDVKIKCDMCGANIGDDDDSPNLFRCATEQQGITGNRIGIRERNNWYLCVNCVRKVQVFVEAECGKKDVKSD